MTRRGRPPGTFGEISLALIEAARMAEGPETMVQLARRARVGYTSARFKVPYLARLGVLVVTSKKRPRLYALQAPERADANRCTAQHLAAAWWPASPSPTTLGAATLAED